MHLDPIPGYPTFITIADGLRHPASRSELRHLLSMTATARKLDSDTTPWSSIAHTLDTRTYECVERQYCLLFSKRSFTLFRRTDDDQAEIVPVDGQTSWGADLSWDDAQRRCFQVIQSFVPRVKRSMNWKK